MDPFTWILKQFQEYRTVDIRIGKKKLKALLADTPEKRMIGLMYTDRLLSDQCMLFVFDDEDMYGIWMRNMNFPIDTIWINSKMKIVDIEQSMMPAKGLSFRTYKPKSPALFVLETASGFVKKNKVSIYTKVFFELPKKEV